MVQAVSALDRFRSILGHVSYRGPDWTLRVEADGGGYWLQVIIENRSEPLHCRKWRLSEHMTRSEIVGTAFKAFLTAEEHECRERFRYRSERVFGPHFDVDYVANLLKEHRGRILDTREEP